MKTIALTGGTGFIGQYLIPELLKNHEIRIRCLTRRRMCGEAFQHKNLEYVQCGYSIKELTDALRGCDAVIHMAAHIPNQENLSAPEEEFSKECVSTIGHATMLFDACVQNKIYNVVFTSSISVYGKGDGKPFVETQRCDPANAYGIAKLAVEKFAGYYHERFGLNIKCLRISQVFGAKFGKRREVQTGLLRMLVENCLNGKAVTVYGTGSASKDYVYVRDICRGIILALQHPDDFGEFNIGIGRPVSTSELADAFCTGFENSAGVVYVKDGKELLVHRSLNIEKAKCAWGYEPAYTLVEACKEMCEIYKKFELPTARK